MKARESHTVETIYYSRVQLILHFLLFLFMCIQHHLATSFCHISKLAARSKHCVYFRVDGWVLVYTLTSLFI